MGGSSALLVVWCAQMYLVRTFVLLGERVAALGSVSALTVLGGTTVIMNAQSIVTSALIVLYALPALRVMCLMGPLVS